LDDLPELGVGIVYFPALEPMLEAGSSLIDTIEIEPQQYWIKQGDAYRLDDRAFDRIQQWPQSKLVHGVGLPVGGSVGLDTAQIEPFIESIQRLDPPWVSEHLAFLRAASAEGVFHTGFLLPPLQSAESLATAVRNIRLLRSRIRRPLAFENAANYLKPLAGEIPDGKFLAAVAEQADCGILLDLHNLWCNHLNDRQSVTDALSSIPLKRVWEVHLAGGDDFEGYWLDSHSGLVPEALMEICRDLFPRLPNLKGVTFEIIPEYVSAKSIGIDTLLAQIESIRALWEMRGSHSCRTRHIASTCDPYLLSTTPPTRLPPQAEWEQAFGLMVNRRPPSNALQARLAGDPGVGVLQALATNVRAGMLVDLLTLSYRMMVLNIGEEAVHDLMGSYWQQTLPEPFAGQEARRFAHFIRAQCLPIAFLQDVLAYEVASIEALSIGEEVRIDFSCDPIALIGALQAGRHPGTLPVGRYEVTIQP
jgi:uncharacterized protein